MARQGIKFQLVPPNAIQFHFKRELDTYDISHYSAGRTEGRMPEGEVKYMLQAINALRKPIWEKHLLAVSFQRYIFSVSSVAFSLYQIYIARGNGLLVLLGVALFIGIVVLVTKSSYFSFEKVQRRIRAECQVLVDQYNQDLTPRGLIWYIPHYFSGGIELHREYESLHPQSTTSG